MKTLLLILVFFSVVTATTKAQSFEDFYEHNFGFFTPMSYMYTQSNSFDSLNGHQSKNFWGLLSLEGTMANANRWGSSFWVKERQIGDMVYVLRGLLSKNKVRKFNSDYYLSDMGFLPNLRYGLNVMVKDKTIINVGLAHNYYIYRISIISNGKEGYSKNDLLCFGPNVYLDRMLTKWLALRVGTCPQYNYARGTKMDYKPMVWEHNIELFSSIGFYFGVDFLTISRIKDDFTSNIKMHRIDLKFGYKFKFSE